VIKCIRISSRDKRGDPSSRSERAYKNPAVSPGRFGRKSRGGPSNPDDLNEHHRRVNTHRFPISREAGFPGIPQKHRDPVNQSSTPACKQGSQYVYRARRKPERYFSGNDSCVFPANDSSARTPSPSSSHEFPCAKTPRRDEMNEGRRG